MSDPIQPARAKLNQGDYEGALELINEWLAEAPEEFEGLQLRARALYLLGRDDEAIATLKDARQSWNTFFPPSEKHVAHEEEMLGKSWEGDEEPPLLGEDALETLLALREHHRLDEDLVAFLGELAEDLGRYEIARAAYEDVVGREPGRRDAWEGLVHVLSHEDLDACQRVAQRALKRFPRHALFHEYDGYIHARRRHFSAAIAAYRKALQYGGGHPDMYEALAHVYLELDDCSAALETVAEEVQRFSEDAEAVRFAVETAIDCEDFRSALRYAHMLLRLEPSRPETYTYVAWVEVTSGDWTAAERTLRLGFHKASDGTLAITNLAELLVSDGALGDALRVADLACELAPDSFEAAAARGRVLHEMGRSLEALEEFRRAAAIVPQDPGYIVWQGIIHADMGDNQEALRLFNNVLTPHPNDLWALVSRAICYLTMDTPDKAMADLNRAVEIDPEDGMAFFYRACAHVKLNHLDAAFQDLRRAADLEDDAIDRLETEPLLDPVRDDPRFRELLEPSDEEK